VPEQQNGEFEFALGFILDGLHRLQPSRPKRPAAG
jgi:hypothetical protein